MIPLELPILVIVFVTVVKLCFTNEQRQAHRCFARIERIKSEEDANDRWAASGPWSTSVSYVSGWLLAELLRRSMFGRQSRRPWHHHALPAICDASAGAEPVTTIETGVLPL